MDQNDERDFIFVLKGTLIGHTDWVTQIVPGNQHPNVLVSASRDRTLMVWKLSTDGGDSFDYGEQYGRMTGHHHFIADATLSRDDIFVLSGSWDKTMRLWDLNSCRTLRRFESHTSDVLSVAFSRDNRQIISGSRDKSIKLWNTRAKCMYTIGKADGNKDAHDDWVSSVRFSQSDQNPIFVSAGWDRMIKVWNASNYTPKNDFIGHTGYVNTAIISPDGRICASGGKDYKVMLWDLIKNVHRLSLDQGAVINALCFSPCRYWLCVAAGPAIKIWDLKLERMIDELKPEFGANHGKPPECISLAWSADGSALFAGYTDCQIRVWHVEPNTMPINTVGNYDEPNF